MIPLEYVCGGKFDRTAMILNKVRFLSVQEPGVQPCRKFDMLYDVKSYTSSNHHVESLVTVI
mgnify:CR=1 FL=1